MGWQSRALACSSYNRDPVWLLLLVACDMLQGRPGRVRSVESASFPRCKAVRQARLRQHKASIARSPGRPVRTRSREDDKLCQATSGPFPGTTFKISFPKKCFFLGLWFGLVMLVNTPKNGTCGNRMLWIFLYLETDILTFDLQTDRNCSQNISVSVEVCDASSARGREDSGVC